MQVKMPQLGETVVEGTILKWLKHEGDQVAQDEALFEISTDKVDTEVPSPAAGTLTQILVPEGQTVAVGTDLATIDSGDGAAAAHPEAAKEEPAPSDAASDTASGPPVQESAPVETPQVEPAAVVAAAQAPSQPTPSPKTPSTEPAAAQADQGPRSKILSPLVRRLADEHQVDLGQIQGTGTGGRITKNDILAFVASRGEAAPAAAPAATAAPAIAPATTPAPAPSAPAPAAAPAAPLRAPTAGQGEEVVPVTITNPGPYGSVASVPIISTPNTGILSFDAITKRPVVIDDAIAVRSMVNISMSWDHRVIDGEVATRFLSRVKNNLESWDFAEDIGV